MLLEFVSCFHIHWISGLPVWVFVSRGKIPFWREFPGCTHDVQVVMFACIYLFGLPSAAEEKGVSPVISLEENLFPSLNVCHKLWVNTI